MNTPVEIKSNYHSLLNARLVYACQHNRLSEIGPLIKDGASPQAKTEKGKALLHWAAGLGRNKICIALLDGGAELEFNQGHDYLQWRALTYAVAAGRLKTCHLLYDRGASLDMPDLGGYSPLCTAAQNGQCQSVKFLLDNGADQHATTRDGNSALHCAVVQQDAEKLAAMLDMGLAASVASVLNHQGLTAEGLAASWNRHDMAMVIRSSVARAAAHSAIAELQAFYPSRPPHRAQPMSKATGKP